MIAGISGYRRNATVAVVRDGGPAAVCEQGRVTRVRNVGIRAGGFPDEALAVALGSAGTVAEAISEFVAAEPEIADAVQIDHHLAHAATAFYTSPFERATVVVCDMHDGPDLTVWHGDGIRLGRAALEWRGPGFARLFTRLTSRLGFEGQREEPQVEALARLRLRHGAGRAAGLLSLSDDGIEVGSGFDAYVDAAGGRDLDLAATIAAEVQVRLGELLIEFLRRRLGDTDCLCLGGGLFYNTYLTTLVREAGIAREVFVPVNAGNPGVSLGAALARAAERDLMPAHPGLASPFLGPEYSSAEIKATLDNCKLSYTFLDDSAIARQVVDALVAGELVGWFRGRLEWGTRALGNRSIFANPLSPYVLENLNHFLKRRDSHRAYGLLMAADHVPRHLSGPARSSFMEYEYRVLDTDRLGHLCPHGIDRLRVQTPEVVCPTVQRLVEAFGEATGVPALINTSFNGFHEPIVCSPRDAVRVFYGTGLDLLVVGNFVLRK